MITDREKANLKTRMIELIGGNEKLNELKDYYITRNSLIDWFVTYQSNRPLFCGSMTVKELIETAQETGINVKSYIVKEKLVTDKPVEKWNKEITKESLEYYYLEQGIHPKKIAEMLNTTTENIKYLLCKHGLLGIKAYNTYRKPSKEKIEELYGQCNVKDICERLRISSRTLYNLIEEYGIKKKNRERKVS